MHLLFALHIVYLVEQSTCSLSQHDGHWPKYKIYRICCMNNLVSYHGTLVVMVVPWCYPSVLKYWEKEILKLVARWSSDVLSAANSQVTAHISLRACRVLLKAHLFYLNHYLFLYRACLVLLFSQNPASIQTFNLGNLFTFFSAPKIIADFFGTCGLVYVFATVLFLKRTGQYS